MWSATINTLSCDIFSILGALFDQNSLQSHTAFRYEIEKHNNGSLYRFKLDKYEKTISVADSHALKKSSKSLFLVR